MYNRLIIVFVTLLLVIPFVLSAQSDIWKFDTTWVRGEGLNWEMMLSYPRNYSVDYSDGKVLVEGYFYGANKTFPHSFYFDSKELNPIARPIPFSGLPKQYRHEGTKDIFYCPSSLFCLHKHNRIVWQNSPFVTISDTNFNFIKNFNEPDWKANGDEYHFREQSFINSEYYIRMLNAFWKRKDFPRNKWDFTRFTEPYAPGLKPNQFAGIGFINLKAALDPDIKKVEIDRIVLFETCDTFYKRDMIHNDERAGYLDSNNVFWMTDNCNRNMIRYDIKSGVQRCYSMLAERPSFLPKDEFDILPPGEMVNRDTIYEFRKSGISKYYTKIHHINRGKVGTTGDYHLFVDEAQDRMFRQWIIITRDSLLISTLKSVMPPGVSNFRDYNGLYYFSILEYRKLSTMKVERFVVLPAKGTYLLTADSSSFTLFRDLWEGDLRKWAVVKGRYVE